MKVIFTKCALLLAITGVANAETWSSTTQLTKLYPYSGGLIFNTSYVNESLSTCDNGTRFQVPLDHPNYQVMTSAMMMAYVAGKKIQFNIDAQVQTCMPDINRFFVVD